MQLPQLSTRADLRTFGRMRWRELVIGVGVLLAAAVPITAGKLLIDKANHQQIAAERQGKADTQDANLAIERACRRFAAQAHDQCMDQERAASRQTYHDIADLEAQRVTATWTHYMGIAAIVGTAFGLFGIALVLLTFWENRRAAEAAIAANKIAVDTARRQLRAYVVFTNLEPVTFEAGKVPQFTYEFVNCGQTPAWGLYIIANPFFFDPKEGEPAIRFAREKRDKPHRMTLAPNKPFTQIDPMARALTDEEIRLLNSGTFGCIYAGIIVYRDIFGKRHMTTFKGEWSRDAPHGPGNFKICKTGNRAG